MNFILKWSNLSINQISDKSEHFQFFRKLAIFTQNISQNSLYLKFFEENEKKVIEFYFRMVWSTYKPSFKQIGAFSILYIYLLYIYIYIKIEKIKILKIQKKTAPTCLLSRPVYSTPWYIYIINIYINFKMLRFVSNSVYKWIRPF